jgi:hypothetical protein
MGSWIQTIGGVAEKISPLHVVNEVNFLGKKNES